MRELLRGNVVRTPAFGELEALERGCIVLEDGVVQGVFPQVPGDLGEAAVTDYGDCLILPSFADMHLHAPQYPMLGLGMDLPLLEWLDTYTFRNEARFSDNEYARRVYKSEAKRS